MTETIRRKKQPELLRSQLLQAAEAIAVEQGIHAITLEAVAQQAGVSKGGLQHHFRSKHELLDALFDDVVMQENVLFEELMALDPMEYGRSARASLRQVLEEAVAPSSQTAWRMLLSTMLAEPEVRLRWSEKLKTSRPEDRIPDKDAARLMICRLAAEGLWITDLLGTMPMTSSLRQEVIRQLEQLTHPTE